MHESLPPLRGAAAAVVLRTALPISHSRPHSFQPLPTYPDDTAMHQPLPLLHHLCPVHHAPPPSILPLPRRRCRCRGIAQINLVSYPNRASLHRQRGSPVVLSRGLLAEVLHREKILPSRQRLNRQLQMAAPLPGAGDAARRLPSLREPLWRCGIGTKPTSSMHAKSIRKGSQRAGACLAAAPIAFGPRGFEFGQAYRPPPA